MNKKGKNPNDLIIDLSKIARQEEKKLEEPNSARKVLKRIFTTGKPEATPRKKKEEEVEDLEVYSSLNRATSHFVIPDKV